MKFRILYSSLNTYTHYSIQYWANLCSKCSSHGFYHFLTNRSREKWKKKFGYQAMSTKLELNDLVESDFKINHMFDICGFGPSACNLFILQMLTEYPLLCQASIILGTRDENGGVPGTQTLHSTNRTLLLPQKCRLIRV